MLGCLSPDAGRLENKLWGFKILANKEKSADWQQEPGMELVILHKRELKEWILNGQFDHALHIALIAKAIFQGVFTWDK
jgi:ADP-ribose pyrophosphatase